MPEQTGAALEVRGLSVSLPAGAARKLAVITVDLTVRRGEIVCLVGESGSGKSILAYTIMRLLPKGKLHPTAGEVLLLGENVLAASERRIRDLRAKEMSIIFQEPMTALNPTMTIGDQIGEVLQIHTDLGTPERLARITEIMGQVRLPDPGNLRHVYPHQLSGGQRQRVMIAMALVLKPSLLIADEPTTALDVTTQAQILHLIRDLQRQLGMGVLFITHDFGVVAEIADRVAVMKDGAIVETGRAEAILSRPQHPYTRALIDAVPSGVRSAAHLAQDQAPTLRVEGLSKTFRAVGLGQRRRVTHAVDNVSFSVYPREIVGIVGESGSGKSTVARCVARLIEPTTGRIEIKGKPFERLKRGELREHRKHVQVISQDPYRSFNPRRRVLESLVEGAVNFGMRRAEAVRRAEQLTSLVGLDPGSLARYPHEFSGGQRQRLSIARALVVQPAVLIADEAVSALDVLVQGQVLDLLETVRREFEPAILFITHDLRVAAKICDRVLVMLKGRVVESGATEHVFVNPQHEYTRRLLDSAPNFHPPGGSRTDGAFIRERESTVP